MIFDETMHYCGTHYHALRGALQKKNLWRLVTDDRFIRELRAEMWLQGACTVDHFDPFVICSLEIRGKISELVHGGLPLGCPLCNAMKLLDSEAVPEAWIDNVTDAVLAVAHANGLMSGHLAGRGILMPGSGFLVPRDPV